jgi:hypothetical protein
VGSAAVIGDERSRRSSGELVAVDAQGGSWPIPNRRTRTAAAAARANRRLFDSRPGEPPDCPGLLLQEATGAGRLRPIPANGRVMRARIRRTGPEAEDRSQTALPATGVGLPSPSPCPPRPGGPGEQTRHASAASPAPNPHQPASRRERSPGARLSLPPPRRPRSPAWSPSRGARGRAPPPAPRAWRNIAGCPRGAR